jgi:predicted nucleotidyltransferase
MLDVNLVDLAGLAEALEDRSTQWWFDPASGQLEPWSEDFGGEVDESHPAHRGLRLVEPIDSVQAYGDMEDFVTTVPDPRARGLLSAAIAGRGAFRRFKDTLGEFPDLQAAWFALKDERMARRALDWLAAEGIVDRNLAQRAALQHGDPPALACTDARAIAASAAGALRALYGPRLRRLVLYGSAARGNADPESDIDLLVVLDDMRSSWEERARMDDVLWQLSHEHGIVVSAMPVRDADVRDAQRPLLIRALTEGIDVG